MYIKKTCNEKLKVTSAIIGVTATTSGLGSSFKNLFNDKVFKKMKNYLNSRNSRKCGNNKSHNKFNGRKRKIRFPNSRPGFTLNLFSAINKQSLQNRNKNNLVSNLSVKTALALKKLLFCSFGLSKEGTHVGAVVFSDAGRYTRLAFDFNAYYNLTKLARFVETLPFYGYRTRIDLALEVANKELFTEKAG